MNSYVKQISILTAVFFVPSALIISGFFYFTVSVFQSYIYELDDTAIELADEIFGPEPDEEYEEDIIFDDEFFDDEAFDEEDFIDYVDSADEEQITDDEWELYEQVLNELEEDTYQSAIGSLMPILYTVLFVVFALSLVAALLTVRPLRRALDKQKQFIADASHEIKTPLALMQSEVELFEKEHQTVEPSRESWQSFTTNIRSDISRLAGLAERLLHMARLDNGSAHSAESQTCLVAEINTELAQLTERFTSGNPNHTFAFVPTTQTGTVSGSCLQMKQVFEILLENAGIHTPHGTEITTSTVVEKNHLVITVADNGPGISRHHADYIFDRFYRVDDSRNSKGNGLGLSIAKDLVNQDGGTISVDSTVGEGTTFTLKYQLTK